MGASWLLLHPIPLGQISLPATLAKCMRVITVVIGHLSNASCAPDAIQDVFGRSHREVNFVKGGHCPADLSKTRNDHRGLSAPRALDSGEIKNDGVVKLS
jgi:hypothetical protein